MPLVLSRESLVLRLPPGLRRAFAQGGKKNGVKKRAFLQIFTIFYPLFPSQVKKLARLMRKFDAFA